jgi:hypothetical protein
VHSGLDLAAVREAYRKILGTVCIGVNIGVDRRLGIYISDGHVVQCYK